jgi:TPR repeat protein
MKIFILIIMLNLISCANPQKSSNQPSHEQTPTRQDIRTMPIDQVRKYAVQGNPYAIHALCYRTIYGHDGAIKNYKEAYSWCQKGANAGNNSSQTLLAELYYFGNYVKKDYSKSFQLYKTAAESNHMHAQYIIYFMYSRGQGTNKDDDLALYWLKRSVSNGYEIAIKESEKIKNEKRDAERFLKKNES